MAITVVQLPAALQTVNDLNNQVANLRSLISNAKTLADNGWVIDIGSTTPINVTITPAMQAQLVAQYDTLKSVLVTTFQQLP